MCGITGVIEATGRSEGERTECIERMTAALHHRGPDAGDTWLGEGVALGHRRLAIVDLSEAGAQPMHSACGRYVIVYNGEIYNHADLRRDLERAGAAPNWRGHSDTETLLAGIAHWGLDETLRRGKGMFALALWDRRTRALSLARDRMGEKPLYWGWAGRALVFGSEIKSLRPHPGFEGALCRIAMREYFQYSYVPAPRSIHRDVYKLEPGCILEIAGPPPAPPSGPLRPGDRHETLSIRRYWSLHEELEEGGEALIDDEEAALASLDGALRGAIGRQMLADVPVGAFLSGGIDSSLIVALMQAQSARPVRTFTIGFEEAAFNEAPYAAAVAKHLGTDHTEMTVTQADALDVIPNLPTLYDEPFADSSQIPTHLVCKAARSEVTVALSGDAGDELFGGYNRYFWGPRIWNRIDWMPLPVRRMLGGAVGAVPVRAWDGLGAAVARTGSRFAISRPGDKAHKLARWMRTVRDVDDLYRSIVTDWAGTVVVPGSPPAPTLLDDPMPGRFADDPAGRMMVHDMRTYLPDDILCKVDRAAMGVSLETRVPFLDIDVMRVASRLPPAMKIRGGQGKWALRQLLHRHVPKDLIERPKVGFGIPVGEWVRGPLRPWAEELLADRTLVEEGFLDPEPIARVWDDHVSGRRDWTPRIWSVLMLQAWQAETRA